MLPNGFLLSPLWGETADTQNLGICTKLLSPVCFTFRKKSARNLQAFKLGTFLGIHRSLSSCYLPARRPAGRELSSCLQAHPAAGSL